MSPRHRKSKPVGNEAVAKEIERLAAEGRAEQGSSMAGVPVPEPVLVPAPAPEVEVPGVTDYDPFPIPVAPSPAPTPTVLLQWYSVGIGSLTRNYEKVVDVDPDWLAGNPRLLQITGWSNKYGVLPGSYEFCGMTADTNIRVYRNSQAHNVASH